VNLDDVLRGLLERCPGARGAAIVDPDGIPVVAAPPDASVELLGAELGRILGEVRDAGREFRHGALKHFSVYAEEAIVLLTVLSGGYFLLLLLEPDALVGRARFQSRLTGEALHSEFI